MMREKERCINIFQEANLAYETEREIIPYNVVLSLRATNQKKINITKGF